MFTLRSCLLPSLLSFSVGSIFGNKHYLILTLCSQIFESLRDSFVGGPWGTCNQLVQKNRNETNDFFLGKCLTIVDRFEGLPGSVGTRYRC